MHKKRSIIHELRTTNHQIKRFMDNKTRIEQNDEVTGLQILTLHYLSENPNTDIYQKDIAQRFSIRNSTVTSLLTLMGKNGFIKRESVKQDARLKKISLTDKGAELKTWMDCSMNELEEMLTSNLTNEECEIFFTVIDKLKKSLNEGGTL